MKINFSPANDKLKKLQKKLKAKVYSLDLPSGWSCPFAKECKSKVVGDIYGLKIQDGPHTKFRCYSASLEVIYRHVFLRRLQNFQSIKSLHKSPNRLADNITLQIPKDAQVIRWHSAGDFFSKNYMKAAIKVAKDNPHIYFYGYTKAIGWLNELSYSFPFNLKLVASVGGTQDNLITDKMITATVVRSKSEAKKLKLPIDFNDSHAFSCKTNFALLIHGVQPKGSLK